MTLYLGADRGTQGQLWAMQKYSRYARDGKHSFEDKTIFFLPGLRAGGLTFSLVRVFALMTKLCFACNKHIFSRRQMPGPMRCLFIVMLPEFQLKMALLVAARSLM